MDISGRFKFLAGVVLAVVALGVFFLRDPSGPISTEAARARFTYPTEIDWGPFTEARVSIGGQEVLNGTVTVVSGSIVPLNVQASFDEPPPPTLTHVFAIAHRPANEGGADFSKVDPGQEWEYYLKKSGERPDKPLKFDVPAGVYILRIYVRIEDDTTAIRQLRVHYLGEGSVKVLPAPAAES